jgi:hypothetical protein
VQDADIDGWRATIEGTFPQLRRRADVDGIMLDRIHALLLEYRAGAATVSQASD